MVATSIANARRGRLLQRLAIGVAALTLVGGAADGGRLATSVASAVGMDDVLAGRSPGQRLWAELTKGKAAAAPRPDRQARALPRVRNPAPASTRPAAAVTSPPDIFGPSVLDASPVPPLFAGGLPPEPVPTGFYGGPSFIPAPGIGGGGIGGGGGGGGGGDLPPGEIPGVPEPATWLLMILGFGALGFRLRERRAHRLADAR